MATTKPKRPAEVAAPTATGTATVLVLWIFGQLFPDVEIDAETAGAITLVVTLITGPIWARIKEWTGGMYKAMLVLLCVGMAATGCVTVTTTAPDGTVTKTEQIDMAALVAIPGIIGDLGTELARIDAELNDDKPDADAEARRERRQQIIDRLLELGIEVVQNADTQPVASLQSE